ncbi:MAG: T9SS type A sorting domain-containing protein [Cytophagales bacterium]|nr:T9SS type A sorting domain-containing protein [Cytophagales bacterium]
MKSSVIFFLFSSIVMKSIAGGGVITPYASNYSNSQLQWSASIGEIATNSYWSKDFAFKEGVLQVENKQGDSLRLWNDSITSMGYYKSIGTITSTGGYLAKKNISFTNTLGELITNSYWSNKLALKEGVLFARNLKGDSTKLSDYNIIQIGYYKVPGVITATGGEQKTENIILTSTLGEIKTQHVEESEIILKEGLLPNTVRIITDMILIAVQNSQEELVYPVPFFQYFEVAFPQTGNNKIVLYNSTGVEIKSAKTTGHILRLNDLDRLPSGAYVVRIWSDDHVIQKQIIKQ